MIVSILDKEFNTIETVDSYYSLIWTVRYSSTGDFELHVPMNSYLFEMFSIDSYLYMRDSDRLMIIEDREIKTGSEDGVFMTITGRTLESILDRRTIWNYTVVTGKLQDAISKLLTENVINPTLAIRKIDNFIFEPSTDPVITNLTIDAQFHGEELLATIEEMCSKENIGFKIILTEDNKFKFKLYSGEDRSYDQEDNPYVVFSPSFDNLRDSSYMESIKPYKNSVLIGGEGEGNAKKMATVDLDASSGLDRREIYGDAGGVSTNGPNGTISGTTYIKQLQDRGRELLNEHKFDTAFEGGADTTRTFKYGRDFDIGDIVQLTNEYGLSGATRITEMIFAQDMGGYNVYPTFVTDK